MEQSRRILSLFEAPDLIFAPPLTPDGDGGARCSIAMVGEIDVEVGLVNENADGKDPSA